MANLLTDWQAALTALIQQNPPDGLGIATVLDRERDGASVEEDIACVYAPNTAWQAAADQLFANFFMIIRVWRRFATGEGEPTQDGNPRTVNVDQLSIDLAKLLEPVQTGLIDYPFYFWVSQMVHDYADQGIEARLVGWGNNPATHGM